MWLNGHVRLPQDRVTGQYQFNPNGPQLVFRFTWDMNGGKVALNSVR